MRGSCDKASVIMDIFMRWQGRQTRDPLEFFSFLSSSKNDKELFELQRCIVDRMEFQNPKVLEIVGTCNPREGPLLWPHILRSGDIIRGQVEHVLTLTTRGRQGWCA